MLHFYDWLFRHTEEMIDKLEAAGLGFYVRETQQKLGRNIFKHSCSPSFNMHIEVYLISTYSFS